MNDKEAGGRRKVGISRLRSAQKDVNSYEYQQIETMKKTKIGMGSQSSPRTMILMVVVTVVMVMLMMRIVNFL